jgi:hypothetical protein
VTKKLRKSQVQIWATLRRGDKNQGELKKNLDKRSTFHEHNMMEKRNASNSLIRKLSEVTCLENLGADGRIIFKVRSRKYYGGM